MVELRQHAVGAGEEVVERVAHVAQGVGDIVAGRAAALDHDAAGAGLRAQLGAGADGAFHDNADARVTLVSTGTLGSWDRRRFRANVVLAGAGEDALVGRRVRLGGATVRVVGPVPRCVVTNENPDSGEVDFGTLRSIARYRGEPATELTTPVAHLPDNGAVVLGMYATVEEPGPVGVGDRVEQFGTEATAGS